MFIDKLRMSVAMQQYAKIVKPSDDTLSLTPLTRKIVTGTFVLRTVFKNTSCKFCFLSDDMDLPRSSAPANDDRGLVSFVRRVGYNIVKTAPNLNINAFATVVSPSKLRQCAGVVFVVFHQFFGKPAGASITNYFVIYLDRGVTKEVALVVKASRADRASDWLKVLDKIDTLLFGDLQD